MIETSPLHAAGHPRVSVNQALALVDTPLSARLPPEAGDGRALCITNFTPGKVLAPLMLAESEEIGIGSNQRPPHSVPATPTSVMFKTIKTYQKEQKWIKINEKHEKSIENY